MKFKHASELGKYFLLGLALISMAVALFGCGNSGDTGPAGAAGPAGPAGTDATSMGTVTGTVKDLYNNNVAGAAITCSPSVSGVTISPSDANGLYSAVLPNGAYTLTFTKSGYTTQTQTVNAAATKTVTLDVFLEPTGRFAANAGADKTVTISPTATTDYTLSGATVTAFDPTLTSTPTYSWSIVNGLGTVKSGGDTLTPVVTLNKRSDYKAFLAEKSAAPRYGAAGEVAALNRWRVVPLTVGVTRQPAQGVIQALILRLTVTNGGETRTDDVVLSVALPVVPNTGLRNQPVGQPILLQGPAQASYAWTMTGPAGSTATLNDATTRYPDFIPDVNGTYTISEAGTPRITITAGNYAGMMAGYRTPDVGCGSSGACHTQFDNNARMNTWLNTGHMNVMFEGMKEAPPGGHYSATCAACHTTGWNYYTTTVQNGSFFEKMNAVTNASGQKLFDWFNANHIQGNPNVESLVATQFPGVYKLAGIQCEVCHGPNFSPAHGFYSAANGLSETARINYSSNTCGFCHGRPASHGAFQQVASSGHGNYELAEGEGTSSRTSCTGCHSAQGFFLYKKQLEAGNSSRTVTVPAGQAAWGADAVEPITCIVCHDPHNEGNLVVSEEIPIRIQGNTALLPAGFMANGVGRGAMCITCHNSRAGEPNSGSGNAALHEDGDTTFQNTMRNTANLPGSPSYYEPHRSSQGDVLMGRNAYFLGANTPGERSKHSYIADTCVNCHMKLSDAPAAIGSPSRPDHTFGTTVDKSCMQCHGSYTAEGLQESFELDVQELSKQIARAAYRLANAGSTAYPAGLTYIAGSTPRISLDGGTTRTDWTVYLNGAPGTVGTTGYHPVLAKANWNFALLENDASKGVHNPSFTKKVIDATMIAVKGL